MGSDEESGQHDRRRGKAEQCAQNLQVLPEQPHPPEREQERYARGAEGQDPRDIYQSIYQSLSWKMGAGQT